MWWWTHLEGIYVLILMVERMNKWSLLTFSPLHLVCEAVVSETYRNCQILCLCKSNCH